jgi:phage FluMu protein Com
MTDNTGKKIQCKKCHKTLFFAWILDVVHITIKCTKCSELNTIKIKNK